MSARGWKRPFRVRPSSRCGSGGAKLAAHRFQTHPGTQPLVRVVRRIGQVVPGRQDHDDVLGQGLEFRAVVACAFKRQDFLLRGLDSDVTERRLIERLHPLAGHCNPYAAQSQDRHGADVDVPAA